MPRFRYEAVDASGKRLVGSAEASDKEALLATFRSKGLILLRWLDQGHTPRFSFRRSPPRLKGKELLNFTKDLGQLLKSGLSMDRALSVMLSSGSEKTVVATSRFLKDSLREGKALSEAMASRPSEFSSLYVNMVRVGEMGGVLPEVMTKLAEFQKRSEETKRFIISSSIYPSILITVGIISVLVIMGFVVPKFASIFNDLNVDVPPSTQLLIEVSNIMKQWWWMIPLLGSLAFLFLRRFFHSPFGKEKIDRFIIKSPIFGNLVKEIQIGRFTRTLGTLIMSGIPLLKALSIVREVMGNQLVKKAVDHVYEKVREGKRISSLMHEEKIFPPIVVQMAAVGEETGRIGEMLTGVSEELDDRVQTKIKTYLSLLEPLAILFMGLIIGGIVISMLTAIFGINEIQF